MVRKGDRKGEAVGVPKLEPVKHLSDFTIKTDAGLKGKNVTHIHASGAF